jgi:hypothetical protein
MVEETKVRDCVKDTSYPAGVENILRSARQHHCSMEALVELAHLPARQYGSADEVISQVSSRSSSSSSS